MRTENGYLLVKANTGERLAEGVQLAQSRGWETCGGVAVIGDPAAGGCFVQALRRVDLNQRLQDVMALVQEYAPAFKALVDQITRGGCFTPVPLKPVLPPDPKVLSWRWGPDESTRFCNTCNAEVWKGDGYLICSKCSRTASEAS